jgi:hypothetical protein
MAWIELHQSVFAHRKTMEAADALGMQEPHVVGHLSALWCWCLDNAPEGTLPDSRRIIAKGALWLGDPDQFVDVLISANLISVNEDGRMTITNWDQYGGKLAERKRENAAKQARYRERMKSSTDTSPSDNQSVTVTSPSRYVLEKSREEERTGQEIPSVEGDAREKKPTPLKKPCRMTLTWQPDELPRDKFDFSEVELRRQLDLFRDHFFGNGKTMADWNAAWRNWLRRSVAEFAPRQSSNGHSKFAASGQKLLTSADLKRMSQGEDHDPERDPGVVVDSQFRVAEPADHRRHGDGVDLGLRGRALPGGR